MGNWENRLKMFSELPIERSGCMEIFLLLRRAANGIFGLKEGLI
jgi:hypothetical protein